MTSLPFARQIRRVRAGHLITLAHARDTPCVRAHSSQPIALCYNALMNENPLPAHNTAPHAWPDTLEAPAPEQVRALMDDFWHTLRVLGTRLTRNELLLADEAVGSLRGIVLQMMLALNGIRRPPGTRHG